MTEEKAIELGRAVVRLKGWRWLPGMRDTKGWRVVSVTPGHPDGQYMLVAESAGGGDFRAEHDGEVISTWAISTLPDLRDPCTLGGLLALVREAWGAPGIHTDWAPDDYWRVWGGTVLGAGDTEAAALVSALQQAEKHL